MVRHPSRYPHTVTMDHRAVLVTTDDAIDSTLFDGTGVDVKFDVDADGVGQDVFRDSSTIGKRPRTGG